MQDGDGRHPGPVHPPAGQGGRVQVGGVRVQRGRPEVQHRGHQDTGQCRQSAMMIRVVQHAFIVVRSASSPPASPSRTGCVCRTWARTLSATTSGGSPAARSSTTSPSTPRVSRTTRWSTAAPSCPQPSSSTKVAQYTSINLLLNLTSLTL